MKDFAKKRAFLDERVEPSVYGAKTRVVKPKAPLEGRSFSVGSASSEKVPLAKRPLKLGPWLLLLVVILILGSVAEKMVQTYRSEQPANWHEFVQSLLHKKNVAKTTANSQAAAKPEEAHGPTFDFYTVLPGQSTSMPTLQNKPQPLPNAQANGTTNVGAQAAGSVNPAVQINSQYLLVVGAYKAKQQATEMRSRLSLMNISSHITEAMVKGKMVYRVEMGPYDTKEAADNVRDQIQQQGVIGVTVMTTAGTI